MGESTPHTATAFGTLRVLAPKWRIEFTGFQQKNTKWFFDDVP